MSHPTGRRRRGWVLATAVSGAAIGAMLFASSALGAGSTKPSMEVLPSAKGLKYQQTVEIKGHHLPKGSGTVAATICGLQDSTGKTIAKPGADDCAGAEAIGKLVQVKPWQSNGEFDTKYTLPTSGQKFGKNKRFCDKTHHCALVVADANPDKPAYYLATVIQFSDQQPFGAKPTATTKPAKKTTPTSASRSSSTPTTGASSSSGGAHATWNGDANLDPSHAEIAVRGGFQAAPPTGAPSFPALPAPGDNPIPPEVASALDQACAQIADGVKQAGGDASALLTACSALTSGGGPAQLQAVLMQPTLLCLEGQSAWQNNAQITDACNQIATALTPVTSASAGALAPILGSL
jgi:hypothetical protein